MDEYRHVMGGQPTDAEKGLRTKILHAIMERDEGYRGQAAHVLAIAPGRPLRYEVNVFNNESIIVLFDEIPDNLCSNYPREIPSRLYAVKLVTKYHNSILHGKEWRCWKCFSPAIGLIHSPALYLHLHEPKIVDYVQPICKDGGECDVAAQKMMAETMRLTADFNRVMTENERQLDSYSRINRT